MSGEEEAPTAAGLFGSNSDGGVRMWSWLEVMCQGCRHESAKYRAAGTGPGVGCRIADGASLDPYNFPVPEWVVLDPVPAPLTKELGNGPWPVCSAYEKRKERADKGLRRGPRNDEDQGALFGRAEVA